MPTIMKETGQSAMHQALRRRNCLTCCLTTPAGEASGISMGESQGSRITASIDTSLTGEDIGLVL